jgi:hypothetical protein
LTSPDRVALERRAVLVEQLPHGRHLVVDGHADHSDDCPVGHSVKHGEFPEVLVLGDQDAAFGEGRSENSFVAHPGKRQLRG